MSMDLFSEETPLWLDSCKQSPPANDHQVFAFWVIAYERFDCIHFSVTFYRYLFVVSCLEMQLHFLQRVAGKRPGMREKQQSHTRTSRSR